MSDAATPPDLLHPSSHAPSQAPATNGVKRKQDTVWMAQNNARPNKAVKRRASKACQCCRARKVRCNVVEQIPCTNCRLDEIECIVSESKRKKKWPRLSEDGDGQNDMSVDNSGYDMMDGMDDTRSVQSVAPYAPMGQSEHKPHGIYNDMASTVPPPSQRRNTFSSMQPPPRPDGTMQHPILNGIHTAARQSPPLPSRQLPPYIKPLPARIGPDEVLYLSKKGALTIPPLSLRNALLKCFIEFVHPFMPLVDAHDLVETIDRNDGTLQLSLLVFQAIMFTGVAMVDISLLRSAGYMTRREARREFFQKTRLLYDFDYEIDRISLIQALLLMTYWYETPDDQKDSHHWMGIAVSLSHTIGLHRNPERSNMDLKQKRLWKRIWWSTYMRDRLIALGMRRPTRIKNEDFDVPILSVDDFPTREMSKTTLSCIPTSCDVMYNAGLQKQLAIMCVEKAKLCICISHVLTTQYSVLHNNHGIQSKEGSTRTTMMLVARKDDPETCGVRNCDEELHGWKASIAPEVDVADPATQSFSPGDECIVVNRSLLHMVYYSTVSALHRPQVLPANTWPSEDPASDLLEMSRSNVRHAANQITIFAESLAKHNLVRFLPTVGITVLLPAIIIHLLDIKAPDETTRRTALQGFCQCMQIMSRLRDIYAAADYSTAFLEAAIRKAEIALPQKAVEARDSAVAQGPRLPQITSEQTNLDPSLMSPASTNAPTPGGRASDAEVASRLTSFLDPNNALGQREDTGEEADMLGIVDFEPDFDALVNLDAAGEAFALDDADFTAGLGSAGGFMSGNVDWMKGLDGEAVS